MYLTQCRDETRPVISTRELEPSIVWWVRSCSRYGDIKRWRLRVDSIQHLQTQISRYQTFIQARNVRPYSEDFCDGGYQYPDACRPKENRYAIRSARCLSLRPQCVDLIVKIQSSLGNLAWGFPGSFWDVCHTVLRNGSLGFLVRRKAWSTSRQRTLIVTIHLSRVCWFSCNSYDAGIQTFDTADVYSNGISETILGKAIKKYNFPRDEIVVMTKFCGVVARTPGEIYYPGMVNHEEYGYVNQMGSSRKVSDTQLGCTENTYIYCSQHVFAAVKHSLERLQLDYIDVLQCHRFDPWTPIEETVCYCLVSCSYG